MNKKSKIKWVNIKCGKCGKCLNSPLDLVIYDQEDGEIVRLDFRHQGRDKCDDRSFYMSRHVQEGFDDLLELWEISPYNKKETE